MEEIPGKWVTVGTDLGMTIHPWPQRPFDIVDMNFGNEDISIIPAL